MIFEVYTLAFRSIQCRLLVIRIRKILPVNFTFEKLLCFLYFGSAIWNQKGFAFVRLGGPQNIFSGWTDLIFREINEAGGAIYRVFGLLFVSGALIQGPSYSSYSG